jgi:hypothetical protein
VAPPSFNVEGDARQNVTNILYPIGISGQVNALYHFSLTTGVIGQQTPIPGPIWTEDENLFPLRQSVRPFDAMAHFLDLE